MKNILFVDDDENLLNGFRRALRKKKDTWSVYFSLDPNKALSLMNQIKMDVVVSDMKMPSMYGSTFLTIVNKKYPDTIRFILSGQSDDKAVFNSLKPSHQFISKPCPAEDIILKIEGVLSSSLFITNSDLKERINNMSSLPTMPDLYIKLEKELQKNDYSLQSVAEIISTDLAMSTQILKIINSSYFGLKKEISDVKEAVSYIGIDYIKNITLVTKVFESSNAHGLFTKSLYEISIVHAAINKTFIEQLEFDKTISSTIYLISMLQNVGVLIIQKIYPELLKEFNTYSPKNILALIEKEEEKFQGNHYLIGSYLLCLWGIKNTIIEPIAYWKTPEKSSTENIKITYLMTFINSKRLGVLFDEDTIAEIIGVPKEKINAIWNDLNAESEE